MMQEPVLKDAKDLRIVVFQWSAAHGPCYECGLPAAFYVGSVPLREDSVFAQSAKRCAVCAANAASDGEEIHRIFPIY